MNVVFQMEKGNSWTYSIDPRAFWAEFEKMHQELLQKELTIPI
jgi:hypothetical protein